VIIDKGDLMKREISFFVNWVLRIVCILKY